jgi:hypothetical protein
MSPGKTFDARAACLAVVLLSVPLLGAAPALAAAPDYSAWGQLLARYYDPARGMSYKALKARDAGTLDGILRQMASVDVASLPRPDQLAYWINLYNMSVVDLIADNYPVESIKDLSTDPIIRLNVFKKPIVQVKGGKLSLNDIENDKIREGFRDPRIHFAINCAAASCPPIRTEPYVGARIDQQLDDQARRFLNGRHGVRVAKDGDGVTLHATKILDWFGKDFESWGGGKAAFVRRYLTADKQKMIDAAKGDVDFDYDDYSWKLNDNSGR